MKDEFINNIGIWGQRHYNYLKNNNPSVINAMRMKGTLKEYLINLNRDAQETYDMLIRQYAEMENVTETLKMSDNLEWTRCMNSIRHRVEEFINTDLIYN